MINVYDIQRKVLLNLISTLKKYIYYLNNNRYFDNSIFQNNPTKFYSSDIDFQ